jgi:transposase-like protein
MTRKNKNLVIVRAVTEQGLTHAQAAARFGVTRQWVHVLVSRYQHGGRMDYQPPDDEPTPRISTIPTPRTHKNPEPRHHS